MESFKFANMLFWGYIVLLLGAYIALRVWTKAIANSWYEVKLKFLKEVYNGEKKEEEGKELVS